MAQKKKPQEPKSASTRRQLKTIRATLARLNLSFKERYVEREDTSFFRIEIDEPSKLDAVTFVHGPGLLTAYALFGVKPKHARMKELLAFANIVNAASRQASVFVRDDASVVYRVAVNYSRVKNIEPGYIAGLIAQLLDMVDVIDLPLILIAKGKSAQAAVGATWVSGKALPFL